MENNPKKTKITEHKQTNKKGRGRRICNNIIIVILAFILIGGVSIFFMLSNIISKVTDKEAVLKDNIVNAEPTAVLAEDGEKIYEIGAESRELVTYAQIPQVTIDAFLAIEDSRFYKHNGFDLPRFISSALNNLKVGDLAQGGSTLTMQTIDNFIMKPKEDADEKAGIKYSQKQRIEHKIQEIYLSMRLENVMSKEEIITAYLNKINFGYSARGIQKGAEYYFGKNVEQLNLSESAFLAGVINAPNTYNAYIGFIEKKQIDFYPYAVERRDETLQQMLNHGFISETEYALAIETELAFQLNGEPELGSNPYEDYAKAAIQEAQELTGVDPATTPMTIHTGLNKDAQKEINRIGNPDLITMPKNDYYQFAVSTIDNNTGVVVALHQGFNSDESNYQSRAIKNTHAPGSTMKPFLDYAPTFDKLGWATSRSLEDKEIIIDNSVKVQNYDKQWHGTVSLATAIGKSYNSPALQALQATYDKIGRDYLVQYLKDYGFSDDIAEQFNMQYGIGASSMVASPMHMSAIYASMANGGNYIEPHLVTKIEFHDGSKTMDIQPKKTQVMSPQAAYMISDLLYQAVNGASHVQNLFLGQAFSGVNYPVYGKTGTSDWDAAEAAKYGGSMKDEWMINYTNEYTVATWTGFDGGIAGKNTHISEAILNMNIPGKINRFVLDTMSKNPTKLNKPDGLSSYAGGLIKSEFLSNASVNNPYMAPQQNTQGLRNAINNASALDSNKYTPESFAGVTTAIKAAQDVINRNAPQAEIDSALAALNSAMGKLVQKNNTPPVEETPQTDKNNLNNAIASSYAYLDPSKYNPTFVDALNNAVANGKNIQNSTNATQAQIDAAAEAISIAIRNCTNNPVAPAQ